MGDSRAARRFWPANAAETGPNRWRRDIGVLLAQGWEWERDAVSLWPRPRGGSLGYGGALVLKGDA